MITQLLEAKVMTAIRQRLDAIADLPPVQIVGAWQPASAVKGAENADTAAVVGVALATPAMPTFTTSEVTFNGSIALSVRIEADVHGSLLVTLADALINLFKDWQSATYPGGFTALDVPGLSIDEVSVQAGEAPSYVEAKQLYTVKLPFTLAGSYRTLST